MPECARCHDFTDNSAKGDYHYCDDRLDQFAEIKQRGVVVEHDSVGEVHVMVTAHDDESGRDFNVFRKITRRGVKRLGAEVEAQPGTYVVFIENNGGGGVLPSILKNNIAKVEVEIESRRSDV